MDWIYSSKVYKASSIKEKILAGSSDPINKELVIQVDKYVNKQVSNENPDFDPENGVPDKDIHEIDVDNSPSTDTHHTHSVITKPSEDDKVIDDDNEEAAEKEPSEDEENSDKENHVSEKVTSSISPESKINDVIVELKGSLNSCEDTKGVVLIQFKSDHDGELWIHYGGQVNVDNVLDTVNIRIEEKGYSSFLEFDRLARNHNAIVYDIHWLKIHG